MSCGMWPAGGGRKSHSVADLYVEQRRHFQGNSWGEGDYDDGFTISR